MRPQLEPWASGSAPVDEVIGQPQHVKAKDFPDRQLGKVIPEGVYDLTRDEGWVSVGIDHDTAEFAGESIRRWWQCMGQRVYCQARELLITADAGGSNGYRCRLWKVVLQRLADELGLAEIIDSDMEIINI